MSRKVYINVVTRLIINADDGVEIDEVMENMDYDFTSNSDGADVEDTEIRDWNITDSKQLTFLYQYMSMINIE